MAERKFVEVEEVKETKKSGVNIDLSELKKIGSAILAFIVANPSLVNKLIDKPATYLKKIVKGENVSSDTKKKVNKTIDDNKSGDVTSILTSLAKLSKGDSETSNIFGNISDVLKKTKASGIDVGSLAGGLGNILGSSSKKTSKKSSNDFGSIIKNLFK